MYGTNYFKYCWIQFNLEFNVLLAKTLNANLLISPRRLIIMNNSHSVGIKWFLYQLNTANAYRVWTLPSRVNTKSIEHTVMINRTQWITILQRNGLSSHARRRKQRRKNRPLTINKVNVSQMNFSFIEELLPVYTVERTMWCE